jgi:hypothetical protein
VTENAGPPLNASDANEADVREQATDVSEVAAEEAPTASLEVDEFDASEQGRPVDLDPDEYR